MLRSLRHISTDSTGWTKKLEKTPDETYVFLWIIVHIINVDISYYVLGKRAEWDRKREREGLRNDMFMEWRNTTKIISKSTFIFKTFKNYHCFAQSSLDTICGILSADVSWG